MPSDKDKTNKEALEREIEQAQSVAYRAIRAVEQATQFRDQANMRVMELEKKRDEGEATPEPETK